MAFMDHLSTYYEQEVRKRFLAHPENRLLFTILLDYSKTLRISELLGYGCYDQGSRIRDLPFNRNNSRRNSRCFILLKQLTGPLIHLFSNKDVPFKLGHIQSRLLINSWHH